RMSRDSQLRNGSSEYGQININSGGVGDLLTRGGPNLPVPANFHAYAEYSRPRKGDWSFTAEVELFSGGLAGNDRIGYSAAFEPTWYLGDTFSLFAGVTYDTSPDWLVWSHDNIVGRYRQRSLELDAGLNWNIDGRQELRVKLQALGLDARLAQAIEVRPDGG